MNLPKKVNEKLMEDTEENMKRLFEKEGRKLDYT